MQKLIDKKLEFFFSTENKNYHIITLIYEVANIVKGFLLNLPCFSEIQNICDLLEENDILMIKFGTGSGKSSLIPPLLLTLGYNRIVVT